MFAYCITSFIQQKCNRIGSYAYKSHGNIRKISHFKKSCEVIRERNESFGLGRGSKKFKPLRNVINAFMWYFISPKLPPKFPHISLRILWNPIRERTEGLSSFSVIKVFLQYELAWLLTKHSPTIFTTRECLSYEFVSDEKGLHHPHVIFHVACAHRFLPGMNELLFNTLHASPSTFPYASPMTRLSPEGISWHCLRMKLWGKVLPHRLCSQGSVLPWNPGCLALSTV